MSNSPTRRVLFHRNYDQYSGGQQKVLDYFTHFLHHLDWEPYILWHPESVDVSETIWAEYEQRVVSTLDLDSYDLLFLAGMDWRYVLSAEKVHPPVINLIQHVRHADPSSDVFQFLQKNAVRICVGEEVKKALDATGKVSGTTVTIENGIDNAKFKDLGKPKVRHHFYVLGNKQPEMAAALTAKLRGKGFSVTSHVKHEAQRAVWQAMSAAEISIVLPHATEGFYLPALEAMALSKLVVAPDCVGNRSFCKHEVNCFMPDLDVESLEAAAVSAWEALQAGDSHAMQQSAKLTLQRHTLQRERRNFHRLLEDMNHAY